MKINYYLEKATMLVENGLTIRQAVEKVKEEYRRNEKNDWNKKWSYW